MLFSFLVTVLHVYHVSYFLSSILLRCSSLHTSCFIVHCTLLHTESFLLFLFRNISSTLFCHIFVSVSPYHFIFI